MQSFLITESRSRENIFSWVMESGIDFVVSYLYDAHNAQYTEDQIEKELIRILS